MLRGRDALDYGIDRAGLDSIGMLGTVMNALSLKFTLQALGVKAEVLSAVGMPPIAELYSRERALGLLSSGHVVIFGAGTGHPFFSTDTAAALRAAELGLDCIIKAIKAAGFRWSGKRKMWHFAPYETGHRRGSGKSTDQLRRQYGSGKVAKERQSTIE